MVDTHQFTAKSGWGESPVQVLAGWDGGFPGQSLSEYLGGLGYVKIVEYGPDFGGGHEVFETKDDVPYPRWVVLVTIGDRWEIVACPALGDLIELSAKLCSLAAIEMLAAIHDRLEPVTTVALDSEAYRRAMDKERRTIEALKNRRPSPARSA